MEITQNRVHCVHVRIQISALGHEQNWSSLNLLLLLLLLLLVVVVVVVVVLPRIRGTRDENNGF
jgi:heme/copper-type cytochrome/quinol oxidase subunit 2